MDFYFIDERGNTSVNFGEFNKNLGKIEKYCSASKYFQLGIVKISGCDFSEFQKHFNNVRYFLNLTKEFEKIVGTKHFYKLWDIIQCLSDNEKCSIFEMHIEKELYDGPYLYTEEDHKFKIFNMYRGLSYAMKVCSADRIEQSQIIIDRFSMTRENESNAVNYLSNKLSKYYKEIKVSFIDSRCCDYLQIADVVLRVTGEKELDFNEKFNIYKTDFIIKKNFTYFKKSGCSSMPEGRTVRS